MVEKNLRSQPLPIQKKKVRIEPLKAWHDVTNLKFIIYLMIFQFHFYLSYPCIIPCKHFDRHLLHCTWLRCIRSHTKDPSHGFLVIRWLVHNWFMNPLEVVVYHLLIGGMVSLGYRDGFPMVCVLVYMFRH